MKYIDRSIETIVLASLENFPVTVIIGPRQCGKSTLVKYLAERQRSEFLYLDLERPSDLEKLRDAEWFLNQHSNQLICIDEIQRRPELFPLIRSLVDEWGRSGCFIVLGSASHELLEQSSESLAGRIIYRTLTPFLWEELKNQDTIKVELSDYLLRGGFPRSILNQNEDISLEWRQSFITTFLERDMLQWVNFTPETMRRLWQMLAHVNGQTVNYSTLANSLGVTSHTVKSYIDLLSSTYMLYAIPPYFSNLGKRLIKAPKVYLSDSGIVTALLHIVSFSDLFGHPGFGAIWETVVLANLKGHFPQAEFYFYRTANGAEIDFVLKIGQNIYSIECKASHVPKLSKGNHYAMEDIQANHNFIVIPDKTGWPMQEGIDVVSLDELIYKIKNFKK
ncbi:MAG: ATP-binding protein [Chitinophagales bacterium]|nr:ATP-binding protein [Chitinophagales bacterium]